MVFSSNIFLFAFLPCVIAIYYLIKRWRGLSNVFLALVSLGFYAWGEPKFVFVMLLSIVVNWLFGLWVNKARGNRRSTALAMTLMVVFNLGLLGIFKYLMFIMNSANDLLGLSMAVPKIVLPIGISFFTFQAMSYVIDVKRGDGVVQKNLMNVILYISFFPQLIAGPIVRYQTVADDIENRHETLDDFIYGSRRFLIGLCKKVILANNLGQIVDTAFALNSSELSVATSWIAACAYLMQVYFDFSGYSDMAIGLGRMFGFRFLENFTFPFICKSISGFWRRWHISLCTWFRDYLYIPLGGSRVKSAWRLLFNMFMVWSLTGLWHGAAWTYFLWGCGFFVMLAVERFTGLGKWMENHKIGHFYALFMVVTITVMIRATDLTNAWAFYGSMFAVNGAKLWDGIASVFIKEYGWFLLASALLGLPLYDIFTKKLRVPDKPLRAVCALALMAATVISVTYLATDSYNPFIYFNF